MFYHTDRITVIKGGVTQDYQYNVVVQLVFTDVQYAVCYTYCIRKGGLVFNNLLGGCFLCCVWIGGCEPQFVYDESYKDR